MALSLPAATRLAEKFAVSIKVMEARLNYLKISHYDSKGNAVIYD